MDGQSTENPEANDNGGLTTEEMLETLVDSGFDLNTLQQWEKTKRNN